MIFPSNFILIPFPSLLRLISPFKSRCPTAPLKKTVVYSSANWIIKQHDMKIHIHIYIYIYLFCLTTIE